jgi:hypothetical protein
VVGRPPSNRPTAATRHSRADGIFIGSNSLSSSSTVGEWTLPPTMFGAIADFQLTRVGQQTADLIWVTLQAGNDSNLTLTISKTDADDVAYAVSDASTAPATTHTVSAYTPTDGDCSLIGTGMAHFTSSGTQWTIEDLEHLASFTGAVVSFKVTPASETNCN